MSKSFFHFAVSAPSATSPEILIHCLPTTHRYEESLLNIMFEYGPRPQCPLSEVEVFVGNILGKTGAQTKRQRELSMSMKERFEAELSFTVRCITKTVSYFYDGEDGEDGEANNDGAMEKGE
jgi:hypothetical protein